MKGRIFDLLTALSLLACVAVLALWVRSYWRGDAVSFAADRPARGIDEWFVRSNCGVLYFARNDDFIKRPGHDPRPLAWDSHPADRLFAEPAAQSRNPHFVLGPFSLGGANLSNLTHIAFTIPHWFPTALAALAPLAWLARSARVRSRRRNGLCVRCGYDLRATPGRCPECWEGSLLIKGR